MADFLAPDDNTFITLTMEGGLQVGTLGDDFTRILSTKVPSPGLESHKVKAKRRKNNQIAQAEFQSLAFDKENQTIAVIAYTHSESSKDQQKIYFYQIDAEAGQLALVDQHVEIFSRWDRGKLKD